MSDVVTSPRTAAEWQAHYRAVRERLGRRASPPMVPLRASIRVIRSRPISIPVQKPLEPELSKKFRRNNRDPLPVPAWPRDSNAPLWKRIATTTAHAYGCTLDEVLGGRRYKIVSLARRHAIWQVWWLTYPGKSYTQIAQMFNMHHTSVLDVVVKATKAGWAEYICPEPMLDDMGMLRYTDDTGDRNEHIHAYEKSRQAAPQGQQGACPSAGDDGGR